MSRLSALSVRSRLPQDLPTLYRWMYTEQNPEWQRWDGPYFDKECPFLSFEAYTERADASPWNEDQQIVALGGECIGFLSRFEEAPSGGGW
ncbi:hypothetical protein [Deinococcus psychrotolerans]|uniref:hypothetical protein n=1 Tax=Deinococcus psychrotolerans TaxID=2489213 RepID=UPI001F1508C7|nr:hypothetical protein [Deinococcus psychrotolerans]